MNLQSHVKNRTNTASLVTIAMLNFPSREDPEKINGDPLELLSSLAFEQPWTHQAPPPQSPSAAETVNSSVLCTGSWENPSTESTTDDSVLNSADTLHETTPQSGKVSESSKDEAGDCSSRRSIMASKPPRRSRFSVLGAVSVGSTQWSNARRKGSRNSTTDTTDTASDRQLDRRIPSPHARQPSLHVDDDDSNDDDHDEPLPGAEAVTRGSAIPRPPIRKGSAKSGQLGGSASERPVRVSASGTEMFHDLSDELVEAQPVKTGEEIKTEIKIDIEKKYQGNTRIRNLLVAEEIDLERADERRKQRRIKDVKGSWGCFTSFGIFSV